MTVVFAIIHRTEKNELIFLDIYFLASCHRLLLGWSNFPSVGQFYKIEKLKSGLKLSWRVKNYRFILIGLNEISLKKHFNKPWWAEWA